MTAYTQRTPREVYALWVDALRSGKFKQGRFRLKPEDDEYCCLGVLCELARLDGGRWYWTTVREAHHYEESEGRYRRHGLLPPPEISLYLELVPYIGKLQRLNDDGIADFNYIADVIEKEIAPPAIYQAERGRA